MDEIEFVNHICEAMTKVGDEYLNVEMAFDLSGRKGKRRRERVYAYEFYHQMRLLQDNYKGYTINGEIDKRGHKIIKESFNPDFVIHRQGEMTGNYCVIELKIRIDKAGIKKDFNTITRMIHDYHYKIGVFAIPGVYFSKIKSILVDIWKTQPDLQEHGGNIYVIAQDDKQLKVKTIDEVINGSN